MLSPFCPASKLLLPPIGAGDRIDTQGPSKDRIISASGPVHWFSALAVFWADNISALVDSLALQWRASVDQDWPNFSFHHIFTKTANQSSSKSVSYCRQTLRIKLRSRQQTEKLIFMLDETKHSSEQSTTIFLYSFTHLACVVLQLLPRYTHAHMPDACTTTVCIHENQHLLIRRHVRFEMNAQFDPLSRVHYLNPANSIISLSLRRMHRTNAHTGWYLDRFQFIPYQAHGSTRAETLSVHSPAQLQTMQRSR